MSETQGAPTSPAILLNTIAPTNAPTNPGAASMITARQCTFPKRQCAVPDMRPVPIFTTWIVAEAAAGADLVVNATSGTASLDALAGLDLDGTVLLDVANPLDFSGGFPPSLSVSNTDSLAEQIQRAHPEAVVVKALNTVTAGVMVDPGKLAEPTAIFVAADDPGGRARVRGLLAELGWSDIVEFPSLDAARGLEMWLPLWVRLMGTLGTADFNLKIVRAAPD